MVNKSSEGLYPGGKEKISSVQITLLLITFIISTADIMLPNFVAQEAGNDSWVSVLTVTPIVACFAFLVAWIGYSCPCKSLHEIMEENLGKAISKIIMLFYIIFFVIETALVLHEGAVIMSVAFLPQTPGEVIFISVMAIVIFAVYNGVETVARLNGVVFPVGIMLLIFVNVLTADEMDLSLMLPVLTDGVLPAYRGGLLMAVWLGEIFILLLLNPYINNPREMLTGAPLAVVAVGGGMLLGTFIIALFGVEVVSILIFPALDLARQAHLGDFIQRFDAFMVVIWFGGIFIKLTVILYLLVKAIGDWIGISNKQPLIVPLAVLLMFLPHLLTPSITDLTNFLHYLLPLVAIPLEFFVPLMLVIVILIRRKLLKQYPD